MSHIHCTDNVLLCTLCPHACRIPEGSSGFCGIRRNIKSELDLPYYGVLSAASVDPVEKKPLYHFHPGSQSYSIGFWGCNLRCPFCQNYQISQNLPENPVAVNPYETVRNAVNNGADSISFTYSEPLIHFEYCMDTAVIAAHSGLSNILVSNGYITEKAGKDLFSLMDAVNIDLKGFSSEYYHKELKGGLDSVCATIEIASQLTHVEITTLIVPGKNDNPDDLDSLFTFLAGVHPQPVLHLSRYFPRYKSSIPATEFDKIRRIADAAKEKLDFVYTGNMQNVSNSTHCRTCGCLLIKRSGYAVKIVNRNTEYCDNCGAALPYVMG